MVVFTENQLALLKKAFQACAKHASDSMSKWLSLPSLITIESVEQVPLEESADLLGQEEETFCFCIMEMTGDMTGSIVLSFNDQNGLCLTDLLLNRPLGTSTAWNEVEQSAALESTNIICTAFLNTLSDYFADSGPKNLIPQPPVFRRDFAESQIESIVMDQAMQANTIFLVQARFEIQNEPLHWILLFVPDLESVSVLQNMIPDEHE